MRCALAQAEGLCHQLQLWRTLSACRVETRLDAFGAAHHKSRHECRLGRHECPMSLSYSFLGDFTLLGLLSLLGDFAFRKRAGARPNHAGSRTPLTPVGKLRLSKDPYHPLHDLLALGIAGRLSEQGQKGVDRILGQRETELARIQV